jgi:hypothetical protein
MQNFLLTYEHQVIIKGGCLVCSTFKWFETEEELNVFIEDHIIEMNFKILEKIEIIDSKSLK